MQKLALVSMFLAAAAALVYLLTGLGVLTVPGLDADPPAAIPYICAGCYLVGGILILTGKRGLLVAGALINLLVMGIFFAMYNQNTDVIFSTPGLGTKIAQILLEIGLIALILRKNPRVVRSH